jgi:hypothetical protein
MRFLGDVIFFGFLTVGGFLGVVFVYTLLVIMPLSLYADMKCAEIGYPKSKVTLDLSRYCMNLDGSVTVKMEKLK